MNVIFEKIGTAITEKENVTCYILQMTYIENLPKLFSFVTSYLKDERLIETFMSPLWKDTSMATITDTDVSKNWLHLLYYRNFNPIGKQM